MNLFWPVARQFPAQNLLRKVQEPSVTSKNKLESTHIKNKLPAFGFQMDKCSGLEHTIISLGCQHLKIARF